MCAYADCGFLGFGITMKNESLDQRIAKQEERLKQLKAQKQAVLAREKKKITDQQRKDDTRRKILLGSYFIKKMNENDANKKKILTVMDEYLTEDRDRKLFDLPPLQKKTYDTFARNFNTYSDAKRFSEKYIEPLNVVPAIITWGKMTVIKLEVEEFGDNYIELANIFYNPNFEKTHEDWEDEYEKYAADCDQKNDLVEDDDDGIEIIEVELDGYPADYDRSLVNRH